MDSCMRRARPPATAYILALLSSSSPRLLKVLLLLGKRRIDVQAACLQLVDILRHVTHPHRFAAFAGVLVGGSTLLQVPIRSLLNVFLRILQRNSGRQVDAKLARRIARFLAALVSASISFGLLNGAPSRPQLQQSASRSKDLGPFDDPAQLESLDVDDATLSAKALSRRDLAGRTMDLTLFTVVRALDIVISSTWARLSPGRQSKLRILPKTAPTALFCFSAATIMHAWFYSPLRLPQTYNSWISAASELDRRLLLALRHIRFGTWIYGKDTGMASLLGSMCADYGLPEALGDPAQTIPIPCELVHMGQGKSCEKHALWRFWRGWIFAAKMYAPLQLIVLIRQAWKLHRPGDKLRVRIPLPVFIRSLVNVARNSAFLGAFISLFYYGVCLSRTRLGPKLFSPKTVTPQIWDSGLCVLAGCLLCGSSILVVQAQKRLEILFFVLPRAAAVWFPRRYLPENRWKEQIAFAVSAAIILTTVQENPRRVRGLFGKLLHRTLKH